MAKSKETFGKREKEKQRLKHKQDKAEKMQERKANATKGKSLDDMIAYVDENGNLSATPPDPKKKKVFKAEDMNTGAAVRLEEDEDREGVVSFFSTEKGYGFIKDAKSGESIFVHSTQLSQPVSERDKVAFRVEQGPRGLSAVSVKKL